MHLNKRYAAALVAALTAVLAGTGPASAAAPNAQDTTFLRASHQSNLAEIATGQLAQRKGDSDAVKQLGARLVADHTRLDRAGGQVAARLNVDLPDAVNAEQRAVARRLQAASGAQFDALFLAAQMESHLKAMRLGEAELARGSDATVKKLASDAAPVIAAHHELVEEAGRALGIPTSVNSGSGGTATAPRSYPAGALGLLGLGVLLVLLGAGYLVRARTRTVSLR